MFIAIVTFLIAFACLMLYAVLPRSIGSIMNYVIYILIGIVVIVVSYFLVKWGLPLMGIGFLFLAGYVAMCLVFKPMQGNLLSGGLFFAGVSIVLVGVYALVKYVVVPRDLVFIDRNISISGSWMHAIPAGILLVFAVGAIICFVMWLHEIVNNKDEKVSADTDAWLGTGVLMSGAVVMGTLAIICLSALNAGRMMIWEAGTEGYDLAAEEYSSSWAHAKAEHEAREKFHPMVEYFEFVDIFLPWTWSEEESADFDAVWEEKKAGAKQDLADANESRKKFVRVERK